jgi:hypothetical protein
MLDCLEDPHDPDELCWDYEMILMVKLFHLIQEHEEMIATVVRVAAAAAVAVAVAVMIMVAAGHDGSSAI